MSLKVGSLLVCASLLPGKTGREEGTGGNGSREVRTPVPGESVGLMSTALTSERC